MKLRLAIAIFAVLAGLAAGADAPQYNGLYVSGANRGPREAARITARPARASAGNYLCMPILVMIYRNYTYDTVTDQEIAKLKDEVEQGRDFFWRNSLCKYDLAIDYLVIDRTLTVNQFWELSTGAYWLQWWAQDSTTDSVRYDLTVNGVHQGDYASIFVFYAWENTDGAAAALGGGTYGVDFGPFNNTAYSSVPLCWDPETNDWFFIHEFHHALDSMFHFSLHAEYPNADGPGEYPTVDFNDGYEFNAWMLRTCNYWSDMNSIWGTMQTFTDADSDGVPDAGDFTITEETMGTDPSDWDTDSDGLGDLGEAAAHYMRGSDPLSMYSDSDSRRDGIDPYPLDPVPEYIISRTATVDGTIGTSEYSWSAPLHTANDNNLSGTVYMAWNASYLYVAANVRDDMVQCPWSEPWWDDGLHIQIDASNDGYEWHGIDNYEIWISPSGSSGNALVSVVIKTIDGDRTDLVLASDLLAKYRKISGGYQIELRIPAKTQTGMTLAAGKTMGFQFEVTDYDTYPGWPRYPLLSRFVDMTLSSSAVQTTSPTNWLNPGWNWFSVPLDPVGSAVAGTLLGRSVDNILYRWDAAGKTVELYPSDFASLEPTQGYLLWLDTTMVAPSYQGYARVTTPAIPIPEQGWTWVGMPKNAATTMANVSVRNEVTRAVRTATQDYSAADPWLNWNWVYWDSAHDTAAICTPLDGGDDNTLRPWYGYRVWSNAEDLKILIP